MPMCENQSTTPARVTPARGVNAFADPEAFTSFLLSLGGARFAYPMPLIIDVQEWGPEVRGEWRVLLARCPLADDGHELGIGHSETKGIVAVRCPTCEAAGREEALNERLERSIAELPVPVSDWIEQPDNSRFSHVRRMSDNTLRGLVRVAEDAP